MYRLFISMAMLAMLVACSPAASPESGDAARPVVAINSPANGSSAAVGADVVISYAAADVQGIAQIELSIDGQPVNIQPVEPPVNSFNGRFVWQFDTPGTHVVQLIAFNRAQVPSEPAQILLNLTGTASAGTTVASSPTPAPPTPTPTPVVVAEATATPAPQVAEAATAPPEPTVPPAPTATPAPANPQVTTVTGLNVRGGPGTNYPIIGRLAANTTLPVTGRDANNAWWQVTYNNAPGWVSGDAQFTTASNTQNVPVVDAPPPPPPPTATPTPVPAVTQRPTILSFTADRYDIRAGENVTLSWDLVDADAAFLRYNNEEDGVVSPGTKVVAPLEDTTYTLVARNDLGETSAQLTITVADSVPEIVTEVSAGEVTINDGDNIDLDEGNIQPNDFDGADFQWDAEDQEFEAKRDSTGEVLELRFTAIELSDCQNTDFSDANDDIQIDEIDDSGCYITSEGRYGKFGLVSQVADTEGSIIVRWQTWSYTE